MRRLFLVLVLGAAGCGLFSQAQVQSAGQQVVATGMEQLACVQTQLASTASSWMTSNAGKAPTATQMAAWSEQAAALCAARYPMVIAIPSAAPSPAS